MAFDQVPHRLYRFRNPEPDQPNDARMRQAAQKYQFAEILVLGDEHPTLPVRQGKQHLIGSM